MISRIEICDFFIEKNFHFLLKIFFRFRIKLYIYNIIKTTKIMTTIASIITKSKSKLMRTAWEIFRSSDLNFSESLKKAWQIMKQAFAKIKLTVGKCSLINFKNVYAQVERPAKEINKEMIQNIVFLVDHFKSEIKIIKAKNDFNNWAKEIRATNNVVVADSIINNYKLD